VCIGGISSGGSGKTPVTVAIAKELLARGKSVVISCSGYGFGKSEAASLAPSGQLEALTWGDEPAELRDLLPDVPIIVGRRRVLAAQICEKEFPDAILLMDDGLQHLPLAKDVTVVLHDPKAGNNMCFPSGPLREPVWFLPSFDIQIPSNQIALEYQRLTFFPEKPEQATVVCAIARPERFSEDVRNSGVAVVNKIFLPDHNDFTELVLSEPTETWVVTHKDWVKLKQLPEAFTKMIVTATRTAQLIPEGATADKILAKLGEGS
jgi:tetraacyldisaccharide 4'-kinase